VIRAIQAGYTALKPYVTGCMTLKSWDVTKTHRVIRPTISLMGKVSDQVYIATAQIERW